MHNKKNQNEREIMQMILSIQLKFGIINDDFEDNCAKNCKNICIFVIDYISLHSFLQISFVFMRK